MNERKELRRYRLYTIKHGQITRATEFEARNDREAVARLSSWRKGGERELWDLGAIPMRLVATDPPPADLESR